MGIKSWLRAFRLRLGKSILDKQQAVGAAKLPPEKILFLRQDGKIGDYIVSSFVFREIKKTHPFTQIGVVCSEKEAYLFKQNPHIDRFYLVKKRNIRDYIRCGLRLRKERYDAVIDPTISLKNRDLLLLRLIGAGYYVGYKKQDYHIFNLNVEGDHHFSELYRLALRQVGFEISNTAYDVPYNKKSAVEIERFLAENHIRRYITVNFYGAYRAKKVNNENIKKYLRYLTEVSESKPLVLLSYPEVTPILKTLAQDYPHIFVHDTRTIFHTIELIRHCDQLISTDTSTVHIASGLNKKIIAIYKQDEKAFINWRPMSQETTHILFYKENINELSPQAIQPEWLVK